MSVVNEKNEDISKELTFKDKLESEFALNSKWDELSVEEFLIQHSSNRQRWCVRLMNFKWDLSRLEKAKDIKLRNNMKENEDFYISKKACIAGLDDNPDISRLNLKIEEIKWCIEFCERACKCLDSLGYDLKNWLEYKKIMQS